MHILWKIKIKYWLKQQSNSDRKKILTAIDLLSMSGPKLGRPFVDTLHSTKYANMKELRVQSNQAVFRLFFIFDPLRRAVILCGGNKKGKNEKIFYTTMITQAETIYERYLKNLQGEITQ
ncbi:type II toxin-antitoxin system RelE/ParE family toxin [Lonepinella sp. BR2271]|uniref:type II toxin-antitoxin system RelE/ParE family toxin n=1 Tax=Lonepinella sp. BR2271 TaxID=3434550 RepID=UPI003F6DFD74